MPVSFNANEIFQIAEQIERNGAHFYRTAAEKFSNEKELLLEIAAQEDEHEKIFANMRKELSTSEKKSNVSDPTGEASAFLKALADEKVFSKDLENLEDIINFAIGKEKDSIVFYLGMKDFISETSGKNKLDDIIKEEMRHITWLANKKES